MPEGQPPLTADEIKRLKWVSKDPETLILDQKLYALNLQRAQMQLRNTAS